MTTVRIQPLKCLWGPVWDNSEFMEWCTPFQSGDNLQVMKQRSEKDHTALHFACGISSYHIIILLARLSFWGCIYYDIYENWSNPIWQQPTVMDAIKLNNNFKTLPCLSGPPSSENLACRLTEIESKATNWPIKFKYNDASSTVAEKKTTKKPFAWHQKCW